MHSSVNNVTIHIGDLRGSLNHARIVYIFIDIYIFIDNVFFFNIIYIYYNLKAYICMSHAYV